MFDPIDIRRAVDNGELQFINRDGRIYCEDLTNGEVVCMTRVDYNNNPPLNSYAQSQKNATEGGFRFEMQPNEDADIQKGRCTFDE